MSEEAELQAEEVEVLKSIYDGDESFKQLNATTYQYKYQEDAKSFILEISWGPKYPTEKPKINLDIFYNQNLLPSVKQKITSIIEEEAEQWVGCAMTYTLFECLKDKVGDLLSEQTAEVARKAEPEPMVDQDEDDQLSKKPERKEQLTKAQKRRQWDRAEAGRGGERARGWDWVDLVKHLSHVPHTTTT